MLFLGTSVMKSMSLGHQKIRKITSVAQQHGISAIDHKGSDPKKYNVLKSKQSFDKKFHFPQEQFGKKPNGKPHRCTHFPSVG